MTESPRSSSTDNRITDPGLICRRCARLVVASAEQFETFERMHYVCFHYEFEHDPFDPDEECTTAGCPSASIEPERVPREPRDSTVQEIIDALLTSDLNSPERGIQVQQRSLGQVDIGFENEDFLLTVRARPKSR